MDTVYLSSACTSSALNQVIFTNRRVLLRLSRLAANRSRTIEFAKAWSRWVLFVLEIKKWSDHFHRQNFQRLLVQPVVNCGRVARTTRRYCQSFSFMSVIKAGSDLQSDGTCINIHERKRERETLRNTSDVVEVATNMTCESFVSIIWQRYARQLFRTSKTKQ